MPALEDMSQIPVIYQAWRLIVDEVNELQKDKKAPIPYAPIPDGDDGHWNIWYLAHHLYINGVSVRVLYDLGRQWRLGRDWVMKTYNQVEDFELIVQTLWVVAMDEIREREREREAVWTKGFRAPSSSSS